ncbi:hypothetical protein [Carnobacterium maltaromaticum]|uniref:hypothetical protein n=1 Tax=Carnobacterium maltaromaticum TaxID=2751 RepID=UPI0028E8C4BC|nr:hypothetical protein [Carnobacterium maltaromaticum]
MNSNIFSQEMEQIIAETVTKMVADTLKRLEPPRGSLKPNKAADYCGVSIDTLERWELAGLKYFKFKGTKTYSINDLDDFRKKHEVNN